MSSTKTLTSERNPIPSSGYRITAGKNTGKSSLCCSALIFSLTHSSPGSLGAPSYSLISRFYEDLAPLLDDEFDHIYSLTYHTILDHTNVDTAPFRESIWYYVHRINGILHEDYDYRDVNTFLNRTLKLYVKNLCFNPTEITVSEFLNIGIELKPEEKVHVALLAACAEKQAMLLYGLHAIMQFMT